MLQGKAVHHDTSNPHQEYGDKMNPKCHACKTTSTKRGIRFHHITEKLLAAFKSINTVDTNPFLQIKSRDSINVLMCSRCSSRSSGWYAAVRSKQTGKRAKNYIIYRKSDTRATKRPKIDGECVICNCTQEEPDKIENGRTSRDYSTSQIQDFSEKDKCVFFTELSRLTKVEKKTLEEIVTAKIDNFIVCSRHRNHNKYAQAAVFRSRNLGRGEIGGTCFLRGTGCKSNSKDLRKILVPDHSSLEQVDRFFELQENFEVHFSCDSSLSEIAGKYACSSCLWKLFGEKKKCPDKTNILLLDCKSDKWTGQAILVCLGIGSFDIPIGFNKTLFQRISKIISEVQRRSVKISREVYAIKYSDVLWCRNEFANLFTEQPIDRKTVEARLCLVLASSGVYLKKLSSKVRCYVQESSFEQILKNAVDSSSTSSIFLPEDQMTRVLVRDNLKMLDQVSQTFCNETQSYWDGEWAMNDVMRKIPTQLWMSCVLQMSSKRRLARWRATANANKTSLRDVFPLSNKEEHLPPPSFEEVVNSSESEFVRSDLLLCTRALKLIEMMVYTRSNGIAGPLTITASIAGIVELSPSTVSVFNSLGLLVSYTTTDKYRLKLIAERERCPRNAWAVAKSGDGSFPPDYDVAVQFDNINKVAMHSVKVDGKPIPIMNGTAVQGIGRRRSRSAASRESNTTDNDRQKLEWNTNILHATRDEFAESYSTQLTQQTLDEFYDIVYGVCFLHREKLGDFGGERCNITNRDVLTKKSQVDFRSLLLATFTPYGGNPNIDELSPQDIVYLNIFRDNATSIVTVQKMIQFIDSTLRPGASGSPRFIIVEGDQPSYKMLFEIWLTSWRNARNKNCDEAPNASGLRLYEWMIPFPGMFHAEKQAMFTICKEMMDGFGLSELSECVGLSASQVSNILKHGHARNNRALLFSMACAMVLHTTDILLTEIPSVADSINQLVRKLNSRQLIVAENGHKYNEKILQQEKEGMGKYLFGKTCSELKPEVLEIGRLLRENVQSELLDGPNGRHFIGTVLFECLLPTVGFHVLSRTGHTDVTDAFWMRMTHILHSTNHLKYQELSIFYGFLRAMMPSDIEECLFHQTPGLSVVKVPRFTGLSDNGTDQCGWDLVFQDESLEMLIIRHTKSLSFSHLSSVENAAAWLMEVSRSRIRIRRVTGASRSYGKVRDDTEFGSELGPLHSYVRNASQSKSVQAMLQLMREKGFLSNSHRGSEWLTNVFSNPAMRMNNSADQENLLKIREKRKLTTALHASVIFHDVFGELTAEDRKVHFDDKQFKRWTSYRKVLTGRQSMKKQLGAAPVALEGSAAVFQPQVVRHTRQVKNVRKMLQDRKNFISIAKDNLKVAEDKAKFARDVQFEEDARQRWRKLHNNRNLISPFADAYYTPEGHVVHAKKSLMLKQGSSSGRGNVHTMNTIATTALSATETSQANTPPVSYDEINFTLGRYYSIQIDVMNALHYPGKTGRRITRLIDIITAKMKAILRKWMTKQGASELRQIHLHIDDPAFLLMQKRTEQNRRDEFRTDDSEASVNLPDYYDDMVLPWSCLLQDREFKYELATLHLYCSHIAIEELTTEYNLSFTVYLHGGSFIVPRDLGRATLNHLKVRRWRDTDPIHMKGGVFIDYLTSSDDIQNLQRQFMMVNSSNALIYNTEDGFMISSTNLKHGESETRFVVAFKTFILPGINAANLKISNRNERGHISHATLVLSSDTDVFMILLLSNLLKDWGILHVLGDTIHHIDNARKTLLQVSASPKTFSVIYCLAGCDFLPGSYGVTHFSYLQGYLRNV